MHQLGGKSLHGAVQVDKRYAHLMIDWCAWVETITNEITQWKKQ
jgi:hypothetical protein